MKRSRGQFRLAAGVALWLAAASPAQATDLQSQVNAAAPGATVHVPAGTYTGPVTIEKSLTLIADGRAVIDGRGQGNVLVIRADNVTIRGFQIQGTGIDLDGENAGIRGQGSNLTIDNNTLIDTLFGIYLQSSPHALVRGNVVGGKQLDLGRRGDSIRLWNCPDSVVKNNRVHDGRDVILWFSNRAHVAGNTVTTSRYGLHFMYSDDDLLENNTLEDNSVGTYMMYSHNLTMKDNQFLHNRGPSGYGVGLKNVDGLDAHDNLFNGNRVGLYVDGSPSNVDVHHTFRHNTFLVNDIGIAFLPNVRRNTFIENNFIDNFEQVAVLGGGDLHDNSFSENGLGNFWSDYRGYDRRATGVGDSPYTSDNLFENLMDREPKLRLFMFSPAQQAVQMAAQAFPVFRPKPKFVDEHPLMAPVLSDATPGGGRSWVLSATFAALLAASLARRLRRKPASAAAAHKARCPVVTTTPNSQIPVVLHVEHLTKRFGKFKAVDDLSFDVRRGEALAIWGRNGAGKTTAIKCILGLLRSKGVIEVCGQSLARNSKAVRRAIGYVPQELNLYDDMTAHQALAFFASLKRVDTLRIVAVLTEVGLESHSRKPVRALSGGMKQRLALAIALLADPPLLLLDEMTSSLDAGARRSFVQLLNAQKQAGKTILFITHRLEEVEMLADHVLVMERGQLQAHCTAAELAGELGLRSRLKVIVSEDALDAAAAALTRAGYRAARNGRGVYVHVPLHRKADPVRELLSRGIAVRDFELDEATDDAFNSQEVSHGNP